MIQLKTWLEQKLRSCDWCSKQRLYPPAGLNRRLGKAGYTGGHTLERKKDMIEVVYDKQEQGGENVLEGILLPKNIRQIGAPSGHRRIYIEDYVMTYLTRLANPNSTYARGAILVGESVWGPRGEVIFISGALPAQNLELDLEETTFDGDTWSYIYQEVKTYFPDLEVVGWFLSRMGFSTAVNDMIVKLHIDNFAGPDKVLYIMDALEGEDAFYLLEEDGLRRQSGYYIYYARNEAMQAFMIGQRAETEPEEPEEIEKKDEAVIRNYRKIMEERARAVRIERVNRGLCAICAMLTIAVLGLGIAVLGNYQMLEKMEGRLTGEVPAAEHVFAKNGSTFGWWNRNTAEQTDVKTSTKDSKMVSEEEKEDTTSGIHEEQAVGDQSVENGTTGSDGVGQKKSAVKPAAAEVTRYYTVQDGDTLSSISFKMYDSVSYVADLMEANGLEESDALHEGDRILVPNVR